jgi:hypothetical protein
MQWGEPWAIARERRRLMGDKEWRRWFAWYPVRLNDGTWAWWEYVEFSQPMKYNVARYRGELP